MALTAAQFFAFLGPRGHEIHWRPDGQGGGTAELRIEAKKAASGLDTWLTWRAAAADYQTALLSLAQQVQADLSTLGA